MEVKNFETLDDVLKLKEGCIFNCLGISSASIFGDKDIMGVRGHLIELPIYNIHVDEPFMIRNVEEGSNSELQIYMTEEKVILGGTWEEG